MKLIQNTVVSLLFGDKSNMYWTKTKDSAPLLTLLNYYIHGAIVLSSLYSLFEPNDNFNMIPQLEWHLFLKTVIYELYHWWIMHMTINRVDPHRI